MSRSTGDGQIENTFIRFNVFTLFLLFAIAFLRFCCIVVFMEAEHDVTASEYIAMENQLVIEMAATRIGERLGYCGVANEAITAACEVVLDRVQSASVGTVLRRAKKRTADAVATCTKLSEMLRDETISESDLTGCITELAYNVFIGHVRDVAWEIQQNGGKA